MSKIDSRLKYLQTQKDDAILRALESVGRFGLEVKNVPAPRVRVLVQHSGDVADLEREGVEITSTAGDVVAGLVSLDRVDALAQVATVSRIESSYPLTSELDVSVPEIHADLVHTGPPGHRGTGVIVGIIDLTGVDWQHDDFRQQDGTSRILRIWDQSLSPQGAEQKPTGFNYGVEYTKSDIDAALTSANPTQIVRHEDSDTDGHGTHVAGIAAGDGSVAGNNQPAFTYVGVAPEADIIVVKNTKGTSPLGGTLALGDSVNTLDAINYIFNQAATLNRPVVINMSEGGNVGPHDGSSVLERGIDNLLGGRGRAFVKSAGNEATSNRHAAGTVAAGATEQIRLYVPKLDDSVRHN